MSVTVYPAEAGLVKQLREALIAPQPGEFVAWLLEHGLVADAVKVQRRQYAEGQLRAWRGLPSGDYLPAATWAGYCDAMADIEEVARCASRKSSKHR